MKVVILAGGLGTRLAEETDKIPKPMVEIGGTPILIHIMNHFANYGFKEFVICVGYKGYLIKEYFANFGMHRRHVTFSMSNDAAEYHGKASFDWTVTLVDAGINTGTAGRVAASQPFVGNERFWLTYGDGISDVNLHEVVAQHEAKRAKATITAAAPPARFGALKIKDALVERFDEKPSGDGMLVNAGFSVIEPSVFAEIPCQTDASWEEGVLARLADQGDLYAYSHFGFWHPMDTLRDKRFLEGQTQIRSDLFFEM